MISIFAFIFAILFIIILIKYKIKIDLVSFLKKGFRTHMGEFGVYTFCGKQGSGKTFATVQFLARNKHKKIYSNVTLKDIPYTHIKTFEEMLQIKDKHCIIVWDEIFSALSKSSKITTEVMEFLSQQRKNEIIFVTTAQEWLEIPITLRRYVRYQIDVSIWNFLPFSILVERYRDGDLLKWDNLENEYVAPIIATKITKMAYKITQMYDTFERIAASAHSANGAGATARIGSQTAHSKSAGYFAKP